MTRSACIRGHVGYRNASGRCVLCRRMLDTAKVAADRASHNARKRAERQHRLADIARKAREARAAESPEKRAARLAYAKAKQREWRANNPGPAGAKKAKRAYKEANPERIAFDLAQRRAKQLQRTPKWLTADDRWMMREAYALARLRGRMFGFAWHVDHIVPLQGEVVSGLHVPWNL